MPTLVITESPNDGHRTRTNFPPTVWPPTGTDGSDLADLLVVRKTWGAFSEATVSLFRFDTSIIPDSATVTYAALQLYVSAKGDADNRSLVGEYYTWTPPMSDSNWVETPGTDAIAGTDLTGIPTGQIVSFPLSTLSSISKTGYTGLRLGISGAAQPTGDNRLDISSLDHATLPEPRLFVIYELAAEVRVEYEAAYVEKIVNTDCTATTELTADTIITGARITADGVTPYVFEVNFTAWGQNSSTAVSKLVLFEDDYAIGTIWASRAYDTSLSASPGGKRGRLIYIPALGSHTYSIRGWVSAASTFRTAGGRGGSSTDVPFSLRIIGRRTLSFDYSRFPKAKLARV